MKKEMRPAHRNVGLAQLPAYMARFPATAWVSLLHRVSGLLLVLALPLVIATLEAALASEGSYERLTAVFSTGWGGLPGWLMKLLSLVLLWAFLHHLAAGLRFVLLAQNGVVGPILEVAFGVCAGAPTPAGGDFTCTLDHPVAPDGVTKLPTAACTLAVENSGP